MLEQWILAQSAVWLAMKEHWLLMILSFVLGGAAWLVLVISVLTKMVKLWTKASPKPTEPELDEKTVAEAQKVLSVFRLLAEHGYTVVKMK